MTADAGLHADTASLAAALSQMGERCASMVDDGIDGLLAGRGPDPRLAVREEEIDALELAIDDQCLRMLALRRPVGSDLRLVTTAMKLVVDLERVGDLAMNLAVRSDGVRLTEPASIGLVRALGQEVGARLRGAVAAVVARDAAAAAAMLEGERGGTRAAADALIASHVDGIAAGRIAARDGLALASIAVYLARIGDHANNIAEMALFLTEGDDVRHPRVTRSGAG